MKSLGWKQVTLVLAAFALVIGLLLAVGVGPVPALKELIEGSMGSKYAWAQTLKEITPLVIAGLAVFVALRAGLFNIGAEGQLLIGALAASAVALNVPNVFGMLLAIIVGTIAGGLWALPAGLIKAYRGGHEVITTIMLNSIAGSVVFWFLSGPLKSDKIDGTLTDEMPKQTWLPNIYEDLPLRVNWVLVVALILVAALAVWFKRTVSGYELNATGANPKAAETAGVKVKKVTVKAMVFSGALAGLAGAFQVLAYEHQFYDGFSSGFGFDALGVALLAGGSPWGVLPAAILFGILGTGTSSMQLLGVPKGLSGILLGLLIIVFAAYRYRKVKSHD